MQPARPSSAVFGLVLALFVAMVLAEALTVQARHAKYGLVIAALLLVGTTAARPRPLAPAQRDYYRGWFAVMLVSLGISLLGALWHGTLGSRFAAETVFVVSPLATAALIAPYVERGNAARAMRWAFLGIGVAYIAETGFAVIAAFGEPSTLLYKVLASDLGGESNTSFLFGLFAIYFGATGQRRWSAGAFVLTVLGFKRIAVIALVAVYLAHLVLRRTGLGVQRHRRSLVIALVAVNALLLLGAYLLSHGYFDDALIDATGASADWVTLGRTGVWRVVFAGLPIHALGNGLGSVTTLLEAHGTTILNAHSDIIKYVVEVGPIASCLWLGHAWWQHTRSRALFLLLAYLNILLVTDNVSIYVTVMFLFYVIAGLLLDDSGGVERRGEAEPAAPP